MNEFWHKIRRVVSIVLVVAMSVTTTPLSAFADDGLTVTSQPSTSISTSVEAEAAPDGTSGEQEVPATSTPEVEVPATPAPEEEVPATPTPEEEVPATPTPEETPVVEEPVRQQLTGTAEDGTAYAVEGVLPEGATLQVAPLEDRTALEGQIGALLGEGQSLSALVVNDVTIVDAEGAAVQPEEPVTVTMVLPEAGENQTVVMFHQKADGTLETAEAGVGALEVSSFSPIGYYVAEDLTPALANRADYINAEPKEIEIGKSFTIEGSIGVRNSWSFSGGEGIVSLEGDGWSAKVTGLAVGTATIVVTHQYGWKTEKFTYTVTVVPAKVTLTYNVNTANGGSGTAPAAVNWESGNAVTLPSMDGQGFIGWSTSATANNGTSENYKQTIYPAGYSYILPAHNVTLYAIWVKDYDANATFFIRLDGTIPREPAEYDGEYYTEGIVVDKAIKQGKFVVDSTGKAVKDNLNKQPTDDRIKQAVQAAGKTYDPATQYILWYVIKQENDGYHVDGVILDKNKYNVTYDPNALVGQHTGKVPNGRQYVEGAPVTVEPQGTLSRNGYTFLGWAEDKNATAPQYTAGNTFAMPAKDVVLYAVWRNIQTYELTVELYAGNPGSSTLLNSQNKEVNWAKLNEYRKYSAAELANEMWGYNFTSASDLYNVQWNPGALKEDVHDYVVRIYVDEESPDLVTVSYDANGGVGTVPESTILVKGENYSPVASDDGLTKTNHEFIGWNTQADGKGVSYAADATIPAVNADTTLYAQWKVKAFTITYVAGAHGSVHPANETVNAGENARGPIAIPETGYKFVKWTDKNGEKVSESATFAPEKVLADAIYTAHFEPKEYNVVYSWTGEPDGVVKPADQPVKFGEPYTIDTKYTSDTVVEVKDAYGNVNGRYTFSGWKLNDEVVTGEQTMGDANVKLVGEWTFTTVEVTKHKVTYDWTGNIPEGKDLPKEITDLVKGQPYDVDSNFTSATVVEVKDAYGNVNGRYTFSGWKLNGTVVTGKQTMGDANVKLVGEWEYKDVQVPQYSIIYLLDGKTYATETKVPNQPISILPAPADREGYTFSGWAVEGYPDGKLPATMPAANLKVTGTFKANNYDYTVNHIYLDRDGGEIGRYPQTGSAAYDTQITYNKELVFGKQTYLFSYDDGPKTIGIHSEKNVLNVYYDIDALVDLNRDTDDDVTNGDGIADKYQVIVTFEVVNGVLRPKGGTVEDDVKSLSTVVTLLDETSKPAEGGTGYLTEQQIPNPYAFDGYDSHGVDWKPATPTPVYEITEDMTFQAVFVENGRPGGWTDPTPTPAPTPAPTPVAPVIPGTVEPEEPEEESPEETEEIVEEETPQAPAEENAGEETIEEEEVPLAGPASSAWALLNLILAILTALGSVLLLIGYFGKKKKEDGENVQYTVNKKGGWRVFSLVPGIGAIVAFFLTESLSGSMVFTDRWTLLMVIIAVIQVIVAILAKKKKEEPDDREAQA